MAGRKSATLDGKGLMTLEEIGPARDQYDQEHERDVLPERVLLFRWRRLLPEELGVRMLQVVEELREFLVTLVLVHAHGFSYRCLGPDWDVRIDA